MTSTLAFASSQQALGEFELRIKMIRLILRDHFAARLRTGQRWATPERGHIEKLLK